MRLSHVPLRLVTGAYLLNSGYGKRGLDAETAKGMQGMAASAVPSAGKMPPEQFGKALSTGEMALGVLLLTPFVSPVVAGAALTAFSGTLLQMYRKTPGMTEEDGIRPTQDGTAIAKDVWMFGIGTALVIDGLIDGTKSAARSTKRSLTSTTKSARKSAAKTRKDAAESSAKARKDAAKRASQARKDAAKRASQARKDAGSSSAKARKDAAKRAARARRSLPV